MDKQGKDPVQSNPGLAEEEETGLRDPSTNGYAPLYSNDRRLETKKEEKTRFTIPVILFVVTSITTLFTGSLLAGGNPFADLAELAKGIPFSFTLLSIFFVHEMGHYLTAKRYGVNTSLPFFIPGPWLPWGIGTFGAVIRIKSPIFKKNALLDIGAAGPIAGFVVSIIAVAVGLQSSEIVEMTDISALFRLGDPIIFSMIATTFGKVPPEGYDIMLTPVAFAGWIGFFITAMNLLPTGQLDGGHITYALLGRKSRFVSIGVIFTLVYLGTVGWKGWFLWAFLCTVIGVRHPPVIDEEVPLDFKHRLVAISSAVIFVVTFMPNPFMFG